MLVTPGAFLGVPPEASPATWVSFAGDGTCTVTATQDGNDEYASAQASQVIEVTTAPALRSPLTGGHTICATGTHA